MKKLKSLGLYKGDLRKAPTRYGKSKAKAYADVIKGAAKVISVPVVRRSAKNKGVGAARSEAKAVAASFPLTVRSQGNKLIVRVSRPSETPVYSRASKTLVIRHKDKAGRKVTYEYLNNLKLTDADLDARGFPILRKDEAFALPFSQGTSGIHYETRASAQEIMELITKYQTQTKNPYKGAMGYVMLAYPGTSRKRAPKRNLKNVVPFRRTDDDERDYEDDEIDE